MLFQWAVLQWLLVVNLCVLKVSPSPADLYGSADAVFEPTICEHYGADCEKENGVPTGNCSSVVKECDAPDVPGKRNHCYALWRNVSGSVVVIMKGCWLDYEECYDRRECVGFAVTQVNNSYFCCCDVGACNRNMSWSSNARQTTRLPPPMEVPIIQPDNAIVRTLLMSLVPLLVLTMLVITGFLLWRCCQASQSDALHDQPLLISPSLADTKPLLSIQLLDLRAHGRFGSVYRAIMTTTGETVAVKVLPVSERQSWLNERAFYSLQSVAGHQNVLKFFGAEQHCSELWIVTEYHDRGSLYDYLKSSVITWNELVSIATTLTRGLAFLHSDVKHHAIAHRDMKSRNVLLRSNMTACIADFGLAVVLEENSLDVHAQVGTRRYMAPEVLDGSINFTNMFILKIDIYACALVLWELVSRCTAFNGPVSSYRMPFEDEVGSMPSLIEMQSAVVTRKLRPHLPDCSGHKGLETVCMTIEDSWDQDPEARLSAECMYERMLLVDGGGGRSSLVLDNIIQHSSDDLIMALESSDGDKMSKSTESSQCTV